jgi:KDO2-lipid IV(A) lauroyltransferase
MASAARDILRRRHEFRLFVLVADQAPVASERSHWVSFMNRDAAFYEGGEIIARATGYPVLFAQCRRRRRGYYEVEFREVARGPHDQNGHHIIEQYARLAEQAIRSEPESWLWSNRRWKRQPPPAGTNQALR